MQYVFEGFDSTKSHPTDKDVLILFIDTGQLVFKLLCYISIKQYIMIGFTNRKKKQKNELSLRKSNTYYSSTQAIGKLFSSTIQQGPG